jgi:hypothetical protein
MNVDNDEENTRPSSLITAKRAGEDSKNNHDDDIQILDHSQVEPKRARRLQEEDWFALLPNELVLHTLKWLSMRELCQMARVSRRFRKLSYDTFLWREVDLSEASVSLRDLWKLIRHKCFAQNVRSITICGRLKQQKFGQATLSSALMHKLAETCGERLSGMHVQYADLGASTVTIADFCLLTGLEQLSLVRCEIPVRWFLHATTPAPYLSQRLKLLDLSGSSRVCHTHLTDLDKLLDSDHKLECLKLNKCYRVDDRCVGVLINLRFFSGLRQLWLDETGVSGRGLEQLLLAASSLETVSVCRCSKISGKRQADERGEEEQRDDARLASLIASNEHRLKVLT